MENSNTSKFADNNNCNNSNATVSTCSKYINHNELIADSKVLNDSCKQLKHQAPITLKSNEYEGEDTRIDFGSFNTGDNLEDALSYLKYDLKRSYELINELLY